MAKIPGVTSEILKKKVLEALEGIGIKASDIMGKGTNVKRLTKGPDINPFKPNMLEAMRSQNKTMGDALDAFANEAKFIMNANDAETLNFLNNLNTYKNIGGAGVDTQGVGSMMKAMTDLEESAKNLKTSADEAKTFADKQMKDALLAAQHGGPFKVPDEKFLGGSMHEEGQLRTGIRNFLQTELKAGRLKLNEKDTHRVKNYYPTIEDDVILVFKKIYGDDAYKKAGTFPGAFEKGESFSHYEKIFRNNMGDEFLKIQNKENIGDGTLVLDESVEYTKPIDDDDLPFNQGGRVGMWRGSAKKGVDSLMREINKKLGKDTVKRASDLPQGTKYENLEVVKDFEYRNPIEETQSKGQIWKDEKGETEMIAMGGFSESEMTELNKAFIKGKALSDAARKMGYDTSSGKSTIAFGEAVSAGMEGWPREIKEQVIRAKYGDIIDQRLLDNMLADDNHFRLADVMATIEQGLKMQETGMGPDEIVDAIKADIKRKPNAAGGGVGSMFRGV